MDYRKTHSEVSKTDGYNVHPNIIDTDLNSKMFPHDMTCLTA